MKNIGRYSASLAAVLAALCALGPSAAAAQDFVCVPTCDVTDTRFLAVTPAGALSSLSPEVLEVTIAVSGDRTSFEFGIFDGDFGGTSGMPLDFHWDLNSGVVKYELFEDPDKDGVSLGEMPMLTLLSGALPDNDWSNSVFPTAETARAESGNFFYVLRVTLVSSASPSSIASFKVRSTGPGTIEIFQQPFAFISNPVSPSDVAIVYPNLPSLTPTTYDGTFSFFVGAETSLEELIIYDGDLDFGSFSQAKDDDDPGTPNDATAAPFAGLPEFGIQPWATAAAIYEGVSCSSGSVPGPAVPAGAPCRTGVGAPMEDRPEPPLVRSPQVNYEVIAPDGRSWMNSNPSGNREWERFEVSTDPGCVAGVTADFCETELLPPGAYEVRLSGLDLQNLNFFLFTLPLRCVDIDGAPCEELRPYKIGDTAFLDLSDDGVQQAGEPGIPGVVMEQVDGNGFIVDRTITDADGKYHFFGEEDEWTVRVAPENFADAPPAGAIGDRVWLDIDGDGAQDGGEPGIPNVRVVLFDAGGDAAPGGGDDIFQTFRRTDDNGNYLFTDLAAGAYYALIDDSSLPANLTLSGGTDPSAIRTVVDDDLFLDLDFGYTTVVGTAVVGDFIWRDFDGDGVQDADEPGIGRRDRRPDQQLQRGSRDHHDRWWLLPVHRCRARTYTVDVTDVGGQLTGFGLTAGPDSNPDPTAPFVVVAGDVILTKDFGYNTGALRATARDVVWFDADRDGVSRRRRVGSSPESPWRCSTRGRDLDRFDHSDADGSFSFPCVSTTATTDLHHRRRRRR